MNRREVKRAPVLRFKGFTNDWEQHKLGDETNRIKSYSISHGFEVAEDTGTKYIHYGDIHTSKVKNINNIDVLPNIKDNNYKPLKYGDVIVADASEDYKGIADACIVNTISDSYKIVAGLHTIAFRPKSKLCSKFLYFYLSTDIFKHFGYKTGTGLKVFGISYKELAKFKLKEPSVTEQKKIVKLLFLIEKAINLQQRKLKLLKEIRKGIVENIRDNNFEYKEQKNDFKDVKIKDMFKITRGKVLPKEKISSNKISPNIYPVFSSQTLNNGLLGFYKDYLFQNAITWTTDGANAGTVNFRNEKFYSTNVNGVLLQKEIKPDLLTADLLNLVAFKYVSKVGNPKLMNNTMANIRIKIPSNTNARIFYSKILNKYDTKIDFINKKIDYLTTFKRFLLQNMFI